MKAIKTTVGVLAGLLYLVSVNQAAAEHVLYKKQLPAKGTIYIETKTVSMNNCAVTLETQGQKGNGTITRAGQRIAVTTFDSDTQITVEIKKDSSKGRAPMIGKRMPEKEDKEPLHGKLVILTQTEGVWTGKLKEGEATAEQQKKIDKMADQYNGKDDNAQIYGSISRQVGDSWDVDPSKLSSFGDDAKKLEGTFKVTFKGIENVKGEDCAVLIADIDVKGATEAKNGTMSIKAKARILRSLKNRVDLENKIEGELTMENTLNQGTGTMKIAGPMVSLSKTEVKVP